MNSIIIVQPGQTLPDIAIQYCGDLAAWPSIASLNGLNITDVIEAGMSLMIPQPIKKNIVEAFANKGVVPASGSNALEGIDYWMVLYEFIVS